MIWSEEALILVALKDGKLSIFGCPQNTQYLSITTINREVSDLGKNPKLLLVEEGKVTVRRGDGSIVHIPVSPFPFQLSKHILGNQWTKAIKVIRHQNIFNTKKIL